VIVLDTHIWTWLFFEPKRISRQAKAAIDRHGAQNGGLVISAITLMETATLRLEGGIDVNVPFADWLPRAVQSTRVAVEPLSIEIAACSIEAGNRLHDPADRIIVATALTLGCALVTRDNEIIDSGLVETIW
jgi:PIN domain nuclease of toxin-antitoxin system